MDVKKGVKIALAMRDMRQRDLAEKLGTSQQRIYQLLNRRSDTRLSTLEELAAGMEMKTWELVKLAEGE